MLTVQDVSARLRCSRATVYELIRSGQLDAFRTTNPRGHWRVTPQAVDRFAASPVREPETVGAGTHA